jgi:hypothetical protein
MTNLERNLNLSIIDRQILVFLLCSVFPGNPEMKNDLRCHCGAKKQTHNVRLSRINSAFYPAANASPYGPASHCSLHPARARLASFCQATTLITFFNSLLSP